MRKQLLLIAFFSAIFFHSVAQDDIAYYKSVLDAASTHETKLAALDSLTLRTIDKDDNAFANYTEQYVDLALQEKQYEGALLKVVKAGFTICSKLQQPNRFLKLVEKVEPFKDQTTNSYARGGIYLKKGAAYFNGKDYETALENYSMAIDYFGEQDSIYIADATYFRGQAKFEVADYLGAVNDYKLASSYYDALGDTDYVYFTEGSIIDVYGINGFDQKAIDVRSALIAKKLKEDNQINLYVLYYNQSLNYEKVGDYQKQEEFLLKALESFKTTPPEHYDNVVVYSSLGIFYAKQNNMVKAKFYLDEVEQWMNEIQPGTLPDLRFKIAKSEYLFLNGKTDEAIKYAKQLVQLSEEAGKTQLILTGKGLLARMYESKGNAPQALRLFKEHWQLQDSIFSLTKTNALSYYQSQFETERREKEILQQSAKIDMLKKDKEIEKGKSKLLWIALISLGLMALGVLFIMRQKANQKRKILQIQLDSNKKELESFTAELLDKSKSYELLSIELEQLKKELGSGEKVEKLQELVSLKILTADHWSDFKSKFNSVYPHLLVQAREVNNEITNAEERLIALEKLNLKTPEIANILGVSSESVVKIRYRLRKKLGISKETSILEFIEV